MCSDRPSCSDKDVGYSNEVYGYRIGRLRNRVDLFGMIISWSPFCLLSRSGLYSSFFLFFRLFIFYYPLSLLHPIFIRGPLVRLLYDDDAERWPAYRYVQRSFTNRWLFLIVYIRSVALVSKNGFHGKLCILRLPDELPDQLVPHVELRFGIRGAMPKSIPFSICF